MVRELTAGALLGMILCFLLVFIIAYALLLLARGDDSENYVGGCETFHDPHACFILNQRDIEKHYQEFLNLTHRQQAKLCDIQPNSMWCYP